MESNTRTTRQTQNPGFSLELQSMRGLAALMVVVGHCFSVFDLNGSPLNGLKQILNGEGAVVFFFTLSGLVLSLQWAKIAPGRQRYLVYIRRRIFRLYPMLIVTVLLGTLYCNYIHRTGALAGTTRWFDSFYTEAISGNRFLLSLAGASARPAAPLWSILVEIVGSALVPFFIMCTGRPIGKWALGAVLLMLSFLLENHTHYNFGIYLIDFYIGITIAWWGGRCAEGFLRFPAILRSAIIIALFLIFFCARRWMRDNHPTAQINLVELISALGVLVLVYHRAWAPRLLRHPVLVRMGDISYSLYILHFPLMYLIANLFFGEESGGSNEGRTLILATATTAASLALAKATYEYIEMPFVRLGKVRHEPGLKAGTGTKLQRMIKATSERNPLEYSADNYSQWKGSWWPSSWWSWKK